MLARLVEGKMGDQVLIYTLATVQATFYPPIQSIEFVVTGQPTDSIIIRLFDQNNTERDQSTNVPNS